MGRLAAMGLLGVVVLLAPVQQVRSESVERIGPIAVVVSTEREGELSKDEIAQIYLKQRRFWRDGSPIVPINREAGSVLRQRFSRAVFGEQARHHELYWNRQYFKGVLPPATLASDDAVARFVRLERNAIGYLALERVGEGLRVLFTIPRD